MKKKSWKNIVIQRTFAFWLNDVMYMVYKRPGFKHSTTHYVFLYIFSITFVTLVAASQENGGNPDNSLRNPGHRISAGLCYASQMTAILSHILDIRLPRKQPYRYIIPVYM